MEPIRMRPAESAETLKIKVFRIEIPPKRIRSLHGPTDDFLPIPLSFSDAVAFLTVLGRLRRLNRSVAGKQEWALERNASPHLVPEWFELDTL